MLWCSYYWFWFWFCGDLGLWIFVGLLVQWYLVLTEVVVVAVAVAVGEKNSGHSSPPWWLLFHVRGHVMMESFCSAILFPHEGWGLLSASVKRPPVVHPDTHTTVELWWCLGTSLAWWWFHWRERQASFLWGESSITVLIQKTSHHGDHGDENAPLPRRAVSHIMLRMQWIELNWGAAGNGRVWLIHNHSAVVVIKMFFWAKTNRRIKA